MKTATDTLPRTLYRLLDAQGRVAATICCGRLVPCEGRNTYTIHGLDDDHYGVLMLPEGGKVETVDKFPR